MAHPCPPLNPPHGATKLAPLADPGALRDLQSTAEPTGAHPRRQEDTRSEKKEMATSTIGGFLLWRVLDAGVHHIFGVPGDFDLDLVQQLEDGDQLS